MESRLVQQDVDYWQWHDNCRIEAYIQCAAVREYAPSYYGPDGGDPGSLEYNDAHVTEVTGTLNYSWQGVDHCVGFTLTGTEAHDFMWAWGFDPDGLDWEDAE